MLASDPECERTKLPQIVIVVDEFADLMLAAKNEVEESVMRLAQARPCGGYAYADSYAVAAS